MSNLKRIYQLKYWPLNWRYISGQNSNSFMQADFREPAFVVEAGLVGREDIRWLTGWTG